MPPPPTPPINNPQIAQVLEPGAGLYSVYVRMGTGLASKFPNKAFNLTITEIGLAPKDAERFAGYVLVGFESMKGSPDLLWVFESLPGAVWDTVSNSRENLTPQKFRGQMTTTKTKQDVVPGTAPDELTGDKVMSTVERQENAGKSVKVDVTEVINENAEPLLGERFAPDGAVLAVSEQLVVDGTETDRGVNIASSEVDALGNGKSVKQTQTAKRRTTTGTTEVGWPKKQKKTKGTDNLTPAKFRRLITTETTTEQVSLDAADVNDIPEPAEPAGDQTVIEHEKVNDYRYAQSITTEVIGEGDPLAGAGLAQGGNYTTAESLVVDGTAEDRGVNIIDSEVTPLGNGKSVKTTRTARKKSGGTYVEGHSKNYRKNVGSENLTPGKFRGLVVRAEVTEQKALTDPDALPDPVAVVGVDDVVSASTEKVNDERFAETTVTEVITEGDPLEGSQLSRYGSISTTEESIVDDATAPITPTHLTIGFEDSPLGNGKSIRSVETVPAFAILEGTEVDYDFNVSVPYTTQIVEAGTTSIDPMEEYTPIDELRTQKRTMQLPPNIDTFELSFPVKANIQLPRVLRSVDVVWNTSEGQGDMDSHFSAESEGQSFSLSCNLDDDASASASLMPEIIPEIEEVSTEGMYCTAMVFYLEMPVTTAAILARTGSSIWPVFRPVAHTIIAFGQNGSVRCAAGVSGHSSGDLDGDGAIVQRSMSGGDSVSSRIDHSVSSNVQRLPPTIHGDITIADAARNVPIQATATMSVSGVNFPTLAANITKTAEVAGAVYPEFLAATSPSELPITGLYLVDSKVSPYKWGYAKVYVELFDATQLDPS